jgi:hypothetical protein
MATWRFYQGLRTEWRWYRFDNKGGVIAQSDQGFAELRGCMANAESAGFTGEAYQVHTRAPSEEFLPVGIQTDPVQELAQLAPKEPVQEPVQAVVAASQAEPDAPAA